MSNFSRRQFLGAAVAAPFASGAASRTPAAARQPNIVFIMADDLGVADLSAYGRNGPGTPFIDSIGTGGMRFRQAYANSSVCSATRTALMTGRYQYRLRIGLEEPYASASQQIGLPPEHPTLPSLLRGRGYTTSLVGKWHLGPAPAYGPLKSGYDRFLGIYGGAVDYFTHRFNAQDTTDPYNGLNDGQNAVQRFGYLTDVLGDESASEVRRLAAGSSPFLLSVHYTAPHWPWEGPDDEEVSRRLSGLQHRDGGNLATYHQMLRSLDDNVGKLLKALQRARLADNTIVIFTSDNGGERFSDVWPLIGRKGELLEGGIRVPLLVRWPARIRRGRDTDQVAMTMDWLPTLLETAGGAADPRFPTDGQSLLPVLEGAATSPRTVYWRYRANDQRAVRDGQWKYLSIGGREYLFDLAADQREQANLRAVHPERFAALQAAFNTWNATMLAYPEHTFSEDVHNLATDRY